MNKLKKRLADLNWYVPFKAWLIFGIPATIALWGVILVASASVVTRTGTEFPIIALAIVSFPVLLVMMALSWVLLAFLD